MIICGQQNNTNNKQLHKSVICGLGYHSAHRPTRDIFLVWYVVTYIYLWNQYFKLFTFCVCLYRLCSHFRVMSSYNFSYTMKNWKKKKTTKIRLFFEIAKSEWKNEHMSAVNNSIFGGMPFINIHFALGSVFLQRSVHVKRFISYFL